MEFVRVFMMNLIILPIKTLEWCVSLSPEARSKRLVDNDYLGLPEHGPQGHNCKEIHIICALNQTLIPMFSVVLPQYKSLPA